MKVLFVHPDDSPVEGVWSQSRWDLVIDLGWAGEAAYRAWERLLGCRVLSFHSFAQGPEDVRRVADILEPGLGILVDSLGFDWWDILAPTRVLELLQVLNAKRVAGAISSAELVGTRFHPLMGLIARWVGRDIGCIEKQQESTARRGLRKIQKVTSLFNPGQLAQIALDKWDMDYRLRAWFSAEHGARRVSPSHEPAILLPSSYVNVTRMLNGYAKLLPGEKFLLVTTRASGAMGDTGKNIRRKSLAGFAPRRLTAAVRTEARQLVKQWNEMQQGPLRANDEITWATENGWFQSIGASLDRWLRIQEAWQHVLSTEHISAVLCGDENNPMNRIPVLLARRQGLPTVHCDHGALNILLSLRTPACGHYLAKGEMERDFMSRRMSIDPRRVTVGAPGELFSRRSEAMIPSRLGKAIVFFSEQHELTLGRTRILYEQLLPGLCAIAGGKGSRVIVKLHPFESPASRRRMLEEVLSAAEMELVDLVHGPPTAELFANIWFAVTVESSVAVDCASRCIPCFLCSWFVQPLTGYEQQFVRYGAALRLENPEQIEHIPNMLVDFKITPEVRAGLWNPIAPATLKALLQKS